MTKKLDISNIVTLANSIANRIEECFVPSPVLTSLGLSDPAVLSRTCVHDLQTFYALVVEAWAKAEGRQRAALTLVKLDADVMRCSASLTNVVQGEWIEKLRDVGMILELGEAA